MIRRSARGLAGDRALLVVLAVGVLVRLGVTVAYWPALFAPDSLGYLGMAFDGGPKVDPTHPFGYPFLIRVFSLAGRHLGLITIAQHLAGITTAVVLYLLVLHLGAGKRLATFAVAVVLLDGYGIALEEHIMTEAFFTLAMVLSFSLVATRTGTLAAAISGGLLAGACLMRPAGLFSALPWLAFLLWRRRGWRAVIAAVACLALPVAGYAEWHAQSMGEFSLTQFDGWTLYSRVAQVASCRGLSITSAQRPLCATTSTDRRKEGVYFLYDANSPAVRAFGTIFQEPPSERAHVDRLLGSFALKVIAAHPLSVARAVGTDFLRYFVPAATDGDGYQTNLAENIPLVVPPSPEDALRSAVNGDIRRGFLHNYRPSYGRLAKAMRFYTRIVHTARPLIAAFTLAILLVFLLAIRDRRLRRHGPELLLLGGGGLAMLVGSAATFKFDLRFLIPAVPLIAGGGVIAVSDLLHRWPALARRPSRA